MANQYTTRYLTLTELRRERTRAANRKADFLARRDAAWARYLDDNPSAQDAVAVDEEGNVTRTRGMVCAFAASARAQDALPPSLIKSAAASVYCGRRGMSLREAVAKRARKIAPSSLEKAEAYADARAEVRRQKNAKSLKDLHASFIAANRKGAAK